MCTKYLAHLKHLKNVTSFICQPWNKCSVPHLSGFCSFLQLFYYRIVLEQGIYPVDQKEEMPISSSNQFNAYEGGCGTNLGIWVSWKYI